ncbi:MAG: class I SAM-dependent methyltransferase [Lysobacteraceae bacterium]|nr:MAG: class I SAM-dependent methyltransferase [Xanthomonadaceae bacterium]
MNSDADDDRRKAWSTYWAAGALHSCAQSYQQNYKGAIAAFWRQRAAQLTAGSRILDLATGNGALPLLLWEEAGPGAGLRIDAVDLAQVAPGWHQAGLHPGISFHSGVAMEELPFSDATFDLVVSQYGLEYAHWPDALQEAVRVAKPGGSVAFVMHHADSVLVNVARGELKNQRLLLEPDGLLTVALEVIPFIAQARRNASGQLDNAEARQARQRYNLAMERVAVEIDMSAVPDLLIQARARVHGLVSEVGVTSAEVQSAAIEALAGQLESAMLRTAELIEHAVDARRLEQLRECFHAGLPTHRIDCTPITQEQGVLGWGVAVTPRPSASVASVL